MPLFNTLRAFVPGLGDEAGCIPSMKSNLEKWKSYTETEEDKTVYGGKKEAKPRLSLQEGAVGSHRTAFL